MSVHTAPILPDPHDVLTELQHSLPQFSTIEWVENTESTNADLMQRAHDADGSRLMPWLRGAHHQNAGRGRAGRTWQNRRGANLMFSCAFDLFMPGRQLPALSPLSGLLTCKALRACLDPAHAALLNVKWPNDILWKNAKLAGILVEATRAGTSRHSPDHHIVVIGLGINLSDARSLSQSLDRQVADWSEIMAIDTHARGIGCAELVSRVARHWYNGLNELIAKGLDELPENFAAVDALIGQSVNVLHDNHVIHTGTACGLNALGQLRVRTAQGEQAVSVGEISVRPR
ncbi:MAG: biotin--[acetyl-CoA-carboxylase] ligase [Alcaligenaceae bacterium]|nr:biotin--[acetyl-CoA-carboxylase] ligase [Alcaligenaceae bacterium]